MTDNWQEQLIDINAPIETTAIDITVDSGDPTLFYSTMSKVSDLLQPCVMFEADGLGLEDGVLLRENAAKNFEAQIAIGNESAPGLIQIKNYVASQALLEFSAAFKNPLNDLTAFYFLRDTTYTFSLSSILTIYARTGGSYAIFSFNALDPTKNRSSNIIELVYPTFDKPLNEYRYVLGPSDILDVEFLPPGAQINFFNEKSGNYLVFNDFPELQNISIASVGFISGSGTGNLSGTPYIATDLNYYTDIPYVAHLKAGVSSSPTFTMSDGSDPGVTLLTDAPYTGFGVVTDQSGTQWGQGYYSHTRGTTMTITLPFMMQVFGVYEYTWSHNGQLHNLMDTDVQGYWYIGDNYPSGYEMLDYTYREMDGGAYRTPWRYWCGTSLRGTVTIGGDDGTTSNELNPIFNRISFGTYNGWDIYLPAINMLTDVSVLDNKFSYKLGQRSFGRSSSLVHYVDGVAEYISGTNVYWDFVGVLSSGVDSLAISNTDSNTTDYRRVWNDYCFKITFGEGTSMPQLDNFRWGTLGHYSKDYPFYVVIRRHIRFPCLFKRGSVVSGSKFLLIDNQLIYSPKSYDIVSPNYCFSAVLQGRFKNQDAINVVSRVDHMGLIRREGEYRDRWGNFRATTTISLNMQDLISEYWYFKDDATNLNSPDNDLVYITYNEGDSEMSYSDANAFWSAPSAPSNTDGNPVLAFGRAVKRFRVKQGTGIQVTDSSKANYLAPDRLYNYTPDDPVRSFVIELDIETDMITPLRFKPMRLNYTLTRSMTTGYFTTAKLSMSDDVGVITFTKGGYVGTFSTASFLFSYVGVPFPNITLQKLADISESKYFMLTDESTDDTYAIRIKDSDAQYIGNVYVPFTYIYNKNTRDLTAIGYSLYGSNYYYAQYMGGTIFSVSFNSSDIAAYKNPALSFLLTAYDGALTEKTIFAQPLNHNEPIYTKIVQSSSSHIKGYYPLTSEVYIAETSHSLDFYQRTVENQDTEGGAYKLLGQIFFNQYKLRGRLIFNGLSKFAVSSGANLVYLCVLSYDNNINYLTMFKYNANTLLEFVDEFIVTYYEDANLHNLKVLSSYTYINHTLPFFPCEDDGGNVTNTNFISKLKHFAVYYNGDTDTNIYIGMVISKTMAQCTYVLNLSSTLILNAIILGYGYLGPDGIVTGMPTPSNYINLRTWYTSGSNVIYFEGNTQNFVKDPSTVELSYDKDLNYRSTYYNKALPYTFSDTGYTSGTTHYYFSNFYSMVIGFDLKQTGADYSHYRSRGFIEVGAFTYRPLMIPVYQFFRDYGTAYYQINKQDNGGLAFWDHLRFYGLSIAWYWKNRQSSVNGVRTAMSLHSFFVDEDRDENFEQLDSSMITIQTHLSMSFDPYEEINGWLVVLMGAAAGITSNIANSLQSSVDAYNQSVPKNDAGEAEKGSAGFAKDVMNNQLGNGRFGVGTNMKQNTSGWLKAFSSALGSNFGHSSDVLPAPINTKLVLNMNKFIHFSPDSSYTLVPGGYIFYGTEFTWVSHWVAQSAAGQVVSAMLYLGGSFGVNYYVTATIEFPSGFQAAKESEASLFANDIQCPGDIGYSHTVYFGPIPESTDHMPSGNKFQYAGYLQKTRTVESDTISQGQLDTTYTVPTPSVVDVPIEMDSRGGVIRGCSQIYIDNDFGEKKMIDTLTAITPCPYIAIDLLIHGSYNLFMNIMATEVLSISHNMVKLLDGNVTSIFYANTDDTLNYYDELLVGSRYGLISLRKLYEPIEADLANNLIFSHLATKTSVITNVPSINIYDNQNTFYGLDGMFSRLYRAWGANGLNIERLVPYYHGLREQNVVKCSNTLPPQLLYGKFSTLEDQIELPFQSQYLSDRLVMTAEDNLRFQKYSLPYLSRMVTMYPTFTETLVPYQNTVVNGVTSLTTQARQTLQSAKLPSINQKSSHYFIIYGALFCMTDTYIMSVSFDEYNMITYKEIMPNLLYKFAGASTTVAYLFNEAQRQLYSFQASGTMQPLGMFPRVKNFHDGVWDYLLNQELFYLDFTDGIFEVNPALDDDTVLDKQLVTYDDKSGKFLRMYPWHRKQMCDDEGDIILRSFGSGVVVQGHRRVEVFRDILQDWMVPSIIKNNDLVVSSTKRSYNVNDFFTIDRFAYVYSNVSNAAYFADPTPRIRGWIHGQAKYATSFLGKIGTDCKFEWRIEFYLTREQAMILQNKYLVVNIASELKTLGGCLKSEVTHIYLTRQMFTRKGKYGLYSYVFNGNLGAGEAERLYIWYDGPVSFRVFQRSCVITTDRTSPLYTQADVQALEMF